MTEHNRPAHNGKKSNHVDLYEQLKRVQQAGILDPYAYAPADFIGIFPYSHRAGDKIVLVDGDKRITLMAPDGLPYGRYPRLLMMWLGREVVRRKGTMPMDEARKIPLGKSLAHFLRECGVIKATNPDGTLRPVSTRSYRALKAQLLRLASTTIHIETTGSGTQGAATTWDNTLISEEGFFWWDILEHADDDGEQYMLLSEKVFLRIAQSCVPVDPVHLAELSTSVAATDLYVWTTRRKSTHDGYTRVTWAQLRGQVGATFPDTDQGMRDFRKQIRQARKKVLAAWPEAGIREWQGGLELVGKETAVPKKDAFPRP